MSFATNFELPSIGSESEVGHNTLLQCNYLVFTDIMKYHFLGQREHQAVDHLENLKVRNRLKKIMHPALKEHKLKRNELNHRFYIDLYIKSLFLSYHNSWYIKIFSFIILCSCTTHNQYLQ